MSNMGYCRFQNTLANLRDCHDHMEDEELSSDEELSREKMIGLCKQIAEEFEDCE